MTSHLFLETSFFIRFFTRDQENKYLNCALLLQKIQSGQLRPYTSSTVIMEIIFILSRHYKFSLEKILLSIKYILLMRQLTLIETTNTKTALGLLKKYRIKYGDCLIATQVPPKAILVTYDEDFAKIPGLKSQKPDEIIKKN